jgi:multimeric flavodoxin WrbA
LLVNTLYISGSPRKDSNTDYLLETARALTGGEFIKLADYDLEPCRSCWACNKSGLCAIEDDMSEIITPMVRDSDALVLGTPVYFNNVSAQLKTFIDRTWPLRGELANKIGGAVVVGRKYGLEGAVTAINAFFLKHMMLPANRGVCGIAFRQKEITQDEEAIEAARGLAERILELGRIIGYR